MQIPYSVLKQHIEKKKIVQKHFFSLPVWLLDFCSYFVVWIFASVYIYFYICALLMTCPFLPYLSTMFNFHTLLLILYDCNVYVHVRMVSPRCEVWTSGQLCLLSVLQWWNLHLPSWWNVLLQVSPWLRRVPLPEWCGRMRAGVVALH